MEILSTVKSIKKKYKEFSDKNGDSFNIFSLLNIESDEVGLHSKFLGELLNPKGSHGQGELFLKLFFKEIGLIDYIDVDHSRTKVVIEEFIGPISSDYTTGGRIDIAIKNIPNKPEVVIENKIYAIDQPKQLYRYFKCYPKGKIIYLTLEGDEPGKGSFHNNEPGKVECVSYRSNIVSWLELAKQKAILPTVLDSTLNQYINTIKNLTNQSINANITKEIMDLLIKDGDSIKAAIEISNALHNAKKELIKKFAETLKTEFAKSGDPEYYIEYNPNKVGEKDSTINFVSTNNKLMLCLYFLTNTNELIIGTLLNPEDQKTELVLLAAQEMKNLGFTKLDKWPRWLWSSKQLKLNEYFSTTEGWANLANRDYHIIQEAIPQFNQILKALKSLPQV